MLVISLIACLGLIGYLLTPTLLVRLFLLAPENRHVFGAYCLYYIDKEQRSGKWQPAAEMGIWVGLSPNSKGGHLICPIQWNASDQVWLIGKTITSRTVKVFDNKFPLRMSPKSKIVSPENFHTFVDKVFNPLFSADALDSKSDASSKPASDPKPKVVPKVKSKGHSAPKAQLVDPEEYEVESLKKVRMCKGRTQYLVKWVGLSNQSNTWEYLENMSCDDLIAEFKSQTALISAEVSRQSLQSDQEAARQASILFGTDDSHARIAVSRLMARQKLIGTVDDYLLGYKTEVINVLKRRIILQDSDQAATLRKSEHIVPLRMILELKRSGRKKGRLICQGFREPVSWDRGSNMSPVAFIDTIRMLILMNGPVSDIISSNDVSVAFLQANGFDINDKRYVSYKAYKEATEFVFELCGPLYGQRVASKQWYCTIAEWLCDRGCIQAQNEPCLFRNPESNLKVVLVVDDLLCRGSPAASAAFHDELEGPSGLAERVCRAFRRKYEVVQLGKSKLSHRI